MDPIANRSDKIGADVEFQVVVTGAGQGGRFSAVNLPNGIRIDDEDGEIHGHVDGPVSTKYVTVRFTKGSVTVYRTFTWQVTPAAPRTGNRD